MWYLEESEICTLLISGSSSFALPETVSVCSSSSRGSRLQEYTRDTSGFHPSAEEVEENQERDASFRDALQHRHLVRLHGESPNLRDGWLSPVSHFAGEAEKRFRPSGFLGSRGKRLLPGLEPLLLARYYQDAEKWKRQPHLGFHGSRG
ncbi:unnamed protein product [Candidula unifasciata]|uniref:Uncharacterized protein n=1 Tax=Candidula unifasciata TaxID=100452 RepID=A0A8S3Z2R9_9EUPU|nr:unnamed protein product [Candidula unifasciata]